MAGAYAGSCVRVDKSLVISQDSDNMALRVEEDDQFREMFEEIRILK